MQICNHEITQSELSIYDNDTPSDSYLTIHHHKNLKHQLVIHLITQGKSLKPLHKTGSNLAETSARNVLNIHAEN